MARLLTVVADKLYVGYDFVDKFYYVIHRDTTTARLTAQEAYDIAIIISPSSAGSTLLEQITALATGLETLTNIYYTLDDNGSGANAIWFNTYKDYALIFSGETLAISGTEDFVYPISSSIVKSKVITEIQYFYQTVIGLNIALTDLSALYDYLISLIVDKPVFNGIAERESEDDNYFYNNILFTSDEAKVQYTATSNPDSLYTYTTSLGTLATATQASNVFVMTSAPSGIVAGDKIKLVGANLWYGSDDGYTDDGIYTIASILNNIITVDEQVPYDYSQTSNVAKITTKAISNGTNLYKRDSASDVSEATAPYAWTYSATTVYTTSTTPIVGDNAFTASTGATVSFSITSLTNNIITLNEAYTKIQLVKDMQITITGSGSDDGTYTIERTYTNSEYTTDIVVYETIPADYTVPSGSSYPVFDLVTKPILYKGVADTSILLDVTSSSKPTKFPTGEFLLDNTSQLTSYLNTANANVSYIIPVPTSTNYDRINTQIPSSISITGLSLPMEFMGIYSDVFS